MSDEIHLTDRSQLSTLASALGSFTENVGASLRRIESYLERVEDALNQRLAASQRNLEQREADFCSAISDLENCEAQEDEDYTPNCSSEEAALEEARQAREEARRDLEFTHQRRYKLLGQIARYRNESARMNQGATRGVWQARTQLGLHDRRLSDYESMAPERGGEDAPESPNAGAAAQAAQAGAFAGGGGGAGGSMAGAGGGAAPSGAYGPMAGKGMQEIEVASIPDEELSGIRGEKDFKKVGIEDMKQGLSRFSEMRSAMRQGQGHDKGYWQEKDREMGLSFPQGYTRVYEAMFGDSHIRISMYKGRATVINGRHRIWLARQMGIRSLPAVVV